MPVRYLEDFAAGQTFGSGNLRISKEQIRSFAAEFDPQPFHVDAAAARKTFFAGLAASGWHTAALTMRLLVDSELKAAGGLVGAGVEELRWPRPVRPGDDLRVESEILNVRASKSRPSHGVVRAKITTLNQNDEPVQIFIATLLVPRRLADGTDVSGPRSHQRYPGGLHELRPFRDVCLDHRGKIVRRAPDDL
jgi:acyl dehydratase